MTRQIDALVAEAMGREILEVGYFGSRGDSLLEPHETPRQVELEEWLDRVGIESIGTYYVDVKADWWREVDEWSPSTDIAAAWEIVDYTKESYVVKLEYGLWWIDNRVYWKAELRSENGTYKGEDPRMPMAICYAFLKSQGVEEPDA